jgi:hypothetical protein
MRRIRFLCPVLIIVSTALAPGRIIHVPADYEYIQDAINVCNDGDTVLVSPGRYFGLLNFNGRNIVLASQFLLTSDSSYIGSTIIDGDSNGTVITLANGEDSTAAIVGLTVQRGRAFSGGGIKCIGASPVIRNSYIINNDARDPYSGSGGGIACMDSSNCTIIDNVIKSNITTAYGGGIFCFASSPLIANNLINFNTLEPSEPIGAGAGIACLMNSNAFIKNNIIEDNVVGWEPGGGIGCSYSQPMITQNVIRRNSAGDGGGIMIGSGAPTVTGNLIVDNDAERTGGGIVMYTSCTFINNVIAYNEAETGGGIFCQGNPATLINDILWANLPDQIRTHYTYAIISYSDIQGGYDGDGNIDMDPKFRDLENGNFHLMSTQCGDPLDSPCIDAGHPDSLDEELHCLAGLGVARSDMGAFGGRGNITSIENESPIEIPIGFSLSQNYPNPFNPTTTIAFELPKNSHVKIEIFDILGRRVGMLLDEERLAGRHQVTWNTGKISSGIYFYRITADEFVDVKKMTLLR